MKIGVFAYNFEHWKTQAGLLNLFLAGYKPDVVFAADPVKLNIKRSTIRIAPKDQFLVHPKKISERLNIDYIVAKHNSQTVKEEVEKRCLDVGIILGARILKPIAFSSFRIGVINMHPGILPENRGLDNVKWAISEGYDQGVTCHLIDKNIDRGLLLVKDCISIYNDDTLLDLHLRVQNLEQKLMLEALDLIKSGDKLDLKPLGKGNYRKAIDYSIEQKFDDLFKRYKELKCRK